MNNRDYKQFTKGTFAHIYNRGNNKENIFLDEQDYKAFLHRLALVLGIDKKIIDTDSLLAMPYSRIRIDPEKLGALKIHAFCLMPNHFHLLIEQTSDVSISKLVSKVCSSFSKYINNKYDRVGNVFQDCFKANIINSNEQLMWVTSYIHMNPVKDRHSQKPENYTWSSYKDFIGERNLPISNTDLILQIFGSIVDFKKQTVTLSSDFEPTS